LKEDRILFIKTLKKLMKESKTKNSNHES